MARPTDLERAIAYLRGCDPVMGALIEQVGTAGVEAPNDRSADHYGALVRTIVGQQLSTKAARAIYGRLTTRFGDRAPTPVEILADDPEQLRAAAGLSRAKVSFLRSLAEHVLDGSLELHRLSGLDEDAVMAELVAVKGIGPWSAHMFLMFHLDRPDVLPVGDLGIRRAMMLSYGLAQLPGPEEMERIAEPWRPHRTLACLFLWEALDAVPA